MKIKKYLSFFSTLVCLLLMNSCGKEKIIDSKIIGIGQSSIREIIYEDDLVVKVIFGRDTLYINYNSNDQIQEMKRNYRSGIPESVFHHILTFNYNSLDQLDEVLINNINDSPVSFDKFKYFHNNNGLIDSIVQFENEIAEQSWKYIFRQ